MNVCMNNIYREIKDPKLLVIVSKEKHIYVLAIKTIM